MTSILSGTFTSAATPVAFTLPLPSQYDYFEMWQITDIGSTAAETQIMRARGLSQMTAGHAFVSPKTSGAATLALENMITSNGFTFFDSSNPPVGTRIAVTAITATSPAQVTAASHGLVVGDTVRLDNINGTMQAMSGQTFTVNSVVDPNNFTITFDASGAFGATPATAGFMRKVYLNPFSPQNVVIGPTSTINSAAAILLNMNTVPSRAQGASQYQPYQRPYQVGAKLRLYMPSGFGTNTSANFLTVQIAQINTQGGYAVANQLQCTILASQPVGAVTTAAGLGALTWPAGAAGYNGQYPLVTDIAEVPTIFSEAEDNTGKYGIIIGTAVQALSFGGGGAASGAKTWQWFARKGYDQGLFV